MARGEEFYCEANFICLPCKGEISKSPINYKGVYYIWYLVGSF